MMDKVYLCPSLQLYHEYVAYCILQRQYRSGGCSTPRRMLMRRQLTPLNYLNTSGSFCSQKSTVFTGTPTSSCHCCVTHCPYDGLGVDSS